jgi:hypothetical protein
VTELDPPKSDCGSCATFTGTSLFHIVTATQNQGDYPSLTPLLLIGLRANHRSFQWVVAAEHVLKYDGLKECLGPTMVSDSYSCHCMVARDLKGIYGLAERG